MEYAELAAIFAGTQRSEDKQTLGEGQAYTYTAVAANDSEAGYVDLEPFGDVISEDDALLVTTPTTVSVKAGETVYLSAYGAGVGKDFYVSGVVGGGDEQQRALMALEHKTQTINFDEDRGLILGEEDGEASATLSSRSLNFDYDGVTQASVGLNGFNANVVNQGRVAWVWDEASSALLLKAVM